MKKSMLFTAFVVTIFVVSSLIVRPLPVYAHVHDTNDKDSTFDIAADGRVFVDGYVFKNIAEYFKSDYFKDKGKRCGTKLGSRTGETLDRPMASTTHCTMSRTVIQNEYWPQSTYIIPIVFHIIHKTDGTGNISDQRIIDQVEVLNEDYRAMAGTLGAQGFDTRIQFELADITRTANNTWFQDRNEFQFKNSLGWAPDRYLNVYTNSASGYLGYATLPQEDAGNVVDGVVVLYEVVGGRDVPGAGDFDQGRTLVHEVGHYLGLLHTFEGYGCYTGYQAGDLIADTNSENAEHYGCSQTYTCGTADPIHNYMNYTDDICMYQFTEEQANRAVCSLVNYRPDLYSTLQSQSTITVTSPNGGESWIAGSTHSVTWTSSGTVGHVKIQYSTNNGSSWSTITSSTINDGAYSWTLPNTTSTQCKVRISEASDGSPSDTSDAVFSIVSTGTPTLTVTAPNGGETWATGSSHSITWTSTGTVGHVKIQYSTNNGSSWSDITASTTNDGAYSWTVPTNPSNLCKVRIMEASDGSPSDTSNGVFSIIEPQPPQIALNRTTFHFGGIIGGAVTGSQPLRVDNSGGNILQWTATASASWLSCSPASGSNAGVVSVSVNTAGLQAGYYSGTITVSDPDAANSPRSVTVDLTVKNSSQDEDPFGTFETPTHGSTVRSSVPVTGWVLDDVGVASVKIYRAQNNNLVYIGDAILVDGARPDVEQMYPDYPAGYQAGWGYMMLTNFLPNGGNGTFQLTAVATDLSGWQTTLGSKTVTVNNANAVKPFGAVDSPAPGGTASGTNYRNSGWVLTPLPNKIPEDGSTINVYIDGVNKGQPVYNIYRADIASLFPTYANSNGAHAYFDFDTTAYSNGIHTIAWTAVDNGGNSDGIGSRYFTVQNSQGARSRERGAGSRNPRTFQARSRTC